MPDASAAASEATPTRCGIDSVEIARIERMLAETPPADLAKIFSKQELADAGDGPGRAASLAARDAAKEACGTLVPRELAHGAIPPPRGQEVPATLLAAAGPRGVPGRPLRG